MTLRGREGNPLGGDALQGQGNVRGVFAKYPAMTPKYHTGQSAGGAPDASLERMARLFLVFPEEPSQLKEKFIRTVPGPAKVFARRMSTAHGGMGYIDFLLTQAQESMSESMQIVQVLSDNYVSYFYGRTPPVFQFNGVLINSVQDDWRVAMWLIYEHLLRGTQMARRKLTVTLAYDSVAVTGVMVNMSEILRAEDELAVPFSFNMLVKRFDVIRRPQLGPTPLEGFPFKIEPDTFASTVVEPARVSRRKLSEPPLATDTREGAEEEEEESERYELTVSKDAYNNVTEEERRAQEEKARNAVFGFYGTTPGQSIDDTAADLDESAS